MEREPQTIPALEHQSMKTCRIDTGDRIARRNLPGGDIRAAVDRELQRNWQLRQVERFAFDRGLVPGRILHDLAWDVGLAPLTERRRQARRLDPETCGE